MLAVLDEVGPDFKGAPEPIPDRLVVHASKPHACLADGVHRQRRTRLEEPATFKTDRRRPGVVHGIQYLPGLLVLLRLRLFF